MFASIREAVPADAPALSRLGEATFRETFMEGGFGIPYPPEDLAVWLPEAYAEKKFIRRMESPVCNVWIAEAETTGEPVGYATVGPCGLPHGQAKTSDGELYQLYVARKAQGFGLGATLFDAAMGWLEREGRRRIWLGVWSGNFKAQLFYSSRGFTKVGDYQFPVGNWRDDEFIFRRD